MKYEGLMFKERELTIRDVFATVTVVVANRSCVTKFIKVQTGESATKLSET